MDGSQAAVTHHVGLHRLVFGNISSESGCGERRQGLHVCDWLAVGSGIAELSGVLVAKGAGG